MLVEPKLQAGKRNTFCAHFQDAGYPIPVYPRYKEKFDLHSRWIRNWIALHGKSLGFESTLPIAMEHFIVGIRTI